VCSSDLSKVIYPPLTIRNSKQIQNSKFKIQNSDYFLIVSRLVFNKRIDIAIEAFNILGLPLKIIGTGRDFNRLKRIANKNIEFMGYVSDENLISYYKNAQALIFPGIEDFGLVMVEAQMFGLPVVAFRGGGAKETSWRLEEFKKRLIVVQKQPFSIKDLKINGKDVMEILGIPSGPKVGEVLEKIFEKVENKMLPNEREILVDFLSKNFVENDK